MALCECGESGDVFELRKHKCRPEMTIAEFIDCLLQRGEYGK